MDPLLKIVEPSLQLFALGVPASRLLHQLLVQALKPGQRHAIWVDRAEA